MPNRKPIRSDSASRITPLGIIAAFVALSESVAGLAAIKTEGAIQLIFAVFAVLFPVFVASLFFAVLWKKAYVFYPPREFGRDVDVTTYAAAMRHQATGRQEILSLVRTSIDETFKSQEARATLSRVTGEDTTSNELALEIASKELAKKAVDRIEESILRVDISKVVFADGAPIPELIFSIDPNGDAFQLLTDIYYQISAFVPAYTYGEIWALQDIHSNQLILPTAVNWADNRALAHSGTTVEAFGLRPGMRLRAILLSRS